MALGIIFQAAPFLHRVTKLTNWHQISHKLIPNVYRDILIGYWDQGHVVFLRVHII